MSFLPAILATVSALVLFLIALKFLLAKAWLKKVFAILALSLAFILMLVTLDFMSYRAQGEGKKIASLSAHKRNSQHFELIFQAHNKIPFHFDVKGDLWQLDLRLLTWSGIWPYLGLNSLYKFDRLSGRYHSIDDERAKPRSLYDLSEQAYLVNGVENAGLSIFSQFQSWLVAYAWLPGVDAVYGNSTYLPMKDGALYALYLYPKGLQAKAENDAARSAISAWPSAN